ncbi:iron ABC transporter permease [Paraneptunicella aestuarii]|nr:iron ABC transporter permease [Paraneptunicella aestuarii]UAA40736.1 iron ABC transporter permease [Paraneptunicella aestuarii]
MPLDRWNTGIVALASFITLPLLVLFGSWAQPDWSIWSHLLDTVLADYVINSIILAAGVGLGTLLLGTLCAWCVVRYRFPFRNIIQWALLLPLAIPGYIIAYTYTGILDFSGPVQTLIRDLSGLRYGQYWFPELQSLFGAIVMLVLVLFPYVYLMAMTAFKAQSSSLYYAAKSMGLNKRQYFFRIALPMARPALLTGAALTMMEAFADYGTVQYFGVPTFTTGIFRVWFGMNSPLAAAQLASGLCLFVLGLLLLEQYSRRKQRFYQPGQKSAELEPQKVSGGKGILMSLLVATPFLLGFLIPVLQLIQWSWLTWSYMLNADFLQLLKNSFVLAAVAALVVVFCALFVSYGKRLNPNRWMTTSTQLAGMGYAIPGTVIAIGVMIPFAWFDKSLNGWLLVAFNYEPGLIFSGTLFVLIFAYTVRFLTVAKHNIDAGLERIKPSMDEAARNMGNSPGQVLKRVHVPLLGSSVLSALLLVFVDVMKELPATLILRPFNFNTLAVRTYELASDERLADAALPAMSIVIMGLIPVILLAWGIDKQKVG